MKKTFMAAMSVCLLAGCSSAQKSEKEIPPVVEAAFKKDFPNINDVDWEKEGDNYEIEFEDGDVSKSAVYNASGMLLETESEIETTGLPQAALDFLETNHRGQKIKEATKIVDRDGAVTYEAEVRGKDLIFDASGNLVKRVDK